MVTIQEVEQREAELKNVEERAKLAVRERIPQRRYGAGITREQQLATIKRREEGRRVLTQVSEQRRELTKVKTQIQQQKTQEIKAREYNAAVETINTAIRQGKVSYYAFHGEGVYKELAQEALKSRTLQVQQLQVKQEVYTDVLGQGISIAPEIAEKQAQKAKVSSLQQELFLTVEAKTAQAKMSQIEERYQPIFGKVEKLIEYPFEKIAKAQEKKIQSTDVIQYRTKVTYYPELKTERIPLTEKQVYAGPQAFRTIGKVASYPVYGLKKIEVYSIDKQARQEFASMSRGQQALEVGNIGLSLYVAGSLTKSALKVKGLNEPINIKETKLPENIYAETKIRNIRSGSKVINIAEFEVTSISPPKKVLQIPNYQRVLSGIPKSELKAMSYEELSLRFPGAKVIETQPLRVTKSITEPFIIKEGKIIRAVGRQGEPVVYSSRISVNTLTKQTRISGKKLSILSGETYPSRGMKTLSPSRSELPPNLRKALEEIETTKGPSGFKITELFDRQTKFQPGGVRMEDVLKISQKELKLIPKGRRVSRGEISSIQKQLMEVRFEGREYGLKEFEVLSERIGVVDITKPRLNVPKKALKIEGVTERLEFELPEDGAEIISIGGGKTSPSLKFDTSLDQKAIQEAISDVALKQTKVQTPTQKFPSPKIEPVKGISPGAVASTQKIEATQAPQVIKPVQLPKVAPSYAPKATTREVQVPKSIPQLKALPKEVTKEVSKEVVKEIPKSIPKLLPKTITKQVPKQIVKQVPKQIVKNIPKAVPRAIPGTSPVRKSSTKPLVPIKLPSIKGKSVKGVPGYRPYVIKQGEKVYVGDILPKGKALKEAEEEAKKSLRATFGVEKTGKKVSGKDIKYKPSKKLFRGYKIKAGKKIPLKDVYIQKQGKRLSSIGEVKEIQAARRMKL